MAERTAAAPGPARRASARAWTSRARGSLLASFALASFGLARRPLRWLGVDPEAFLAILEVKLLLDMKTSPFGYGGVAGGGPDGKGGDWLASVWLVLVMLGFWMMGLFAAIPSLLGFDVELWLAGLFSMELLACGGLMLIHFANLLVDPTDIGVVSSRPVPDGTLFAARLGHVLFYVLMLGAAFAFWPTVLGAVGQRSVVPLVAIPVGALLTALLSVALVGVLYGVTLRIAGPARFQRMMLWVQILAATMMFGGLQVVMRVVDPAAVTGAVERHSALLEALPGVHLVGLYQVLGGDFGQTALLRTAAAFGVPLLVTVAAVALSSRTFVAGLSGSLESTRRRARGWPRGLSTSIARAVTRTRTELAAFDLVMRLSRRERNFLRAALPQTVGLSVVMVVSFMPRGELPAWWSDYSVLGVLFFTVIAPGVLETSQFSETSGARWLLRALPIEDGSALHSAAVRGLCVGFLLPGLVVILVLVTLIGGAGSIPNVALACVLAAVATLSCVGQFTIYFPFTLGPGEGDMRLQNLMIVLGSLGLCVGLALVYALALQHAALYVLALAGALLVARRLWRRLDRMEPAAPPGEVLPTRRRASVRGDRV